MQLTMDLSRLIGVIVALAYSVALLFYLVALGTGMCGRCASGCGIEHLECI